MHKSVSPIKTLLTVLALVLVAYVSAKVYQAVAQGNQIDHTVACADKALASGQPVNCK